jgi:hypothetical protein
MFLEIGRLMLYAFRRPNWSVSPTTLCVAYGNVVMYNGVV